MGDSTGALDSEEEPAGELGRSSRRTPEPCLDAIDREARSTTRRRLTLAPSTDRTGSTDEGDWRRVHLATEARRHRLGRRGHIECSAYAS
jgi:hypothetical protein